MTAVRSDDEQPSVYLDIVDPLPDDSDGLRGFTEVRRAMTLPTLVAQLRREVVSDDTKTSAQAVAALARLAHEGVPGADPRSWWALREVSDDRPLRAEGEVVRVSPSKVESFGQCGLRWLFSACGGDGPSQGAANIGTLVHDIAAEVGDADEATLRAEVDARWGRLGLPQGWVSDRKRLEAHAMVGWLARYFDRATQQGWARIGAELDMEVALGRAVISGRVDRLERLADGSLRVIDYKTGSASSKPREDDLPTHPQLGAYQLAVDRGRLRRARHRIRRRGAAADRQGRQQARHHAAGAAPAAHPRRPAVGRTPRRGDGRGHGRGHVHRHRRPLVRRLRREGQLPRPARGEDTVTTLTGTTPTGTLTGARAYSANDIATALGMHTPTDEQRAVIEAPLAPLLVVAGAGSGKTETMASRVVWLVANGLVEPDQVLGLTFTRKAATELAERITQRLRRLERAGLWEPRTDDEDDGAETLGGTPTVSTYHSYAGRLVREHALRLGYRVRVAAAVRGRGLAVRRRGRAVLRRPDGRGGQGRERPSPRPSSTSPARWPSTS